MTKSFCWKNEIKFICYTGSTSQNGLRITWIHICSTLTFVFFRYTENYNKVVDWTQYFGKLRQDFVRPEVWDQPEQHSENPFLQKDPLFSLHCQQDQVQTLALIPGCWCCFICVSVMPCCSPFTQILCLSMHNISLCFCVRTNCLLYLNAFSLVLSC